MARVPKPAKQTPDEAIIKEARDRFNRCQDYFSLANNRYLNDFKFFFGDSDNGYQWPEQARKSRDVSDKITLTINKTRQYCLNITNDSKQNKASIKCRPTGNIATVEGAGVAEGIVRHIEYNSDARANAEIGRQLKRAGIPLLAVNYSIPGAPLYTADNIGAGRIAGQALGKFAKENWSDQTLVAAILGDISDPSASVTARIQGVTEGLRQELPDVSPVQLDSAGHSVRAGGVLSKFLTAQTRRKVLVATLDDASALAAKSAVEAAGRISDCVIVSQGADRSIHGGASEKKEIDPANRGSVVLGSVAYYFDRYGYEILPIALRMLRGEQVPSQTSTKHTLISAKNVFLEESPDDMN